jgi:ribosome-associated protein
MIEDDSTDAEHGEGGERPSKTQRKKEMHALQALGQQLVDLSRDQLARVDLPDELREAIDFAHKVTSHEGRRRHMQYIGKLMRRVDAEEVRAAIGRATGASRAAVALMHLAERWRDRLLADEPGAWDELGSQVDPAVLRELRSLARQARAERAAERPPAAARKLFRRLREALGTED